MAYDPNQMRELLHMQGLLGMQQAALGNSVTTPTQAMGLLGRMQDQRLAEDKAKQQALTFSQTQDDRTYNLGKRDVADAAAAAALDPDSLASQRARATIAQVDPRFAQAVAGLSKAEIDARYPQFTAMTTENRQLASAQADESLAQAQFEANKQASEREDERLLRLDEEKRLAAAEKARIAADAAASKKADKDLQLSSAYEGLQSTQDDIDLVRQLIQQGATPGVLNEIPAVDFVHRLTSADYEKMTAALNRIGVGQKIKMIGEAGGVKAFDSEKEAKALLESIANKGQGTKALLDSLAQLEGKINQSVANYGRLYPDTVAEMGGGTGTTVTQPGGNESPADELARLQAEVAAEERASRPDPMRGRRGYFGQN